MAPSKVEADDDSIELKSALPGNEGVPTFERERFTNDFADDG